MIDSTRAYAKLVAAFKQNDWPRVQQRSAQLLAIAPDDARLRYMAGVADLQLGNLPQALAYLKKATHLAPRRADYAAQYAKALALLRRTREARLVADRAMTLAPGDAATLSTLGTVYAQAGARVQAATAFRRAVALQPGQASLHLKLAHALVALNDADGAGQSLETCLRLEPRHWRGWLDLALLRPQTAEHNLLARLHGALQEHGDDPQAQLYLQLALGKVCDDLADYPAAFGHYTRGKAAGRRLRPYDAARDAAMFDALMRAFPTGTAFHGDGDDSPAPIFIVGMPGSGITLLEQWLGRHPDVQAAGALPHFPALLQQAAGGRLPLLAAPDIGARTQHIDWRQLGSAYLASAHPPTGQTPRFIDALPHNALLLGFIARALPKAKIICLSRHPLDLCLANFRHLFDQESALFDYSFDLDDTGCYLLRFQRLMAHWRTLLPGRLFELDFEALAQYPQATLRTLLDFCGLPWHGDCAAPPDSLQHLPLAWRTLAPTDAAAIGHWRHYEPQLRNLRQLLAASA